jgi:hypothetical protein
MQILYLINSWVQKLDNLQQLLSEGKIDVEISRQIQNSSKCYHIMKEYSGME